ncbi:MAG: PAS domain S-box protein [Burkholderiaceae bacterium]|nr:MAG: PAS domain S-box protein [Burkholderiaceae bacterium]
MTPIVKRNTLYHLRMLVDRVPSILAYWDRDLICRFANRAYESWFGINPDDLIGMPIADFLGQELFVKNESHIRSVLDGHEQLFERTILGPDGSERYSLVNYIPHVMDGEVLGFMVLASDVSKLKEAEKNLQTEVTERKRLQAELVQSDKLASIGQLAAGVAHEINNPIGYVFSNFGTLEDYLGKFFQILSAYEQAESSISDPAVAARLRELRQAVELDFLKEDIPQLMQESKHGIEQVRQIVRALKDFSRVDSSDTWQATNLHQCIDTALTLANSEIKHKADIVKHYGEIPEVECLPSQINQVVMNLVVNAAQAMGAVRGCITIRTGVEDDQVWFSVSDNGSGIPPETLKRIFEPFFTTKPIGQGTGLGLSVSYGIVQRHNGAIDVTSVPGGGTTFHITLPIRQEKLLAEAEQADA